MRGARQLVPWLLAGLLVAGLAAGVTWWWVEGRSTDEAPLADPDDPDAAADAALAERIGEPLDASEDAAGAQAATEVLAALASDQDVEAALAPGTRAELDAADDAVAGALPAGAEVQPLTDTWLRQGRVASMLVEVRLPDAAEPDVFVAWLVSDPETGDWQLSYTEGPLS